MNPTNGWTQASSKAALWGGPAVSPPKRSLMPGTLGLTSLPAACFPYHVFVAKSKKHILGRASLDLCAQNI